MLPLLPFNSPLRTQRRSGMINKHRNFLKKLELTTPFIYILKLFARCKKLISHELILIEKPSPWL